MVDSLFKCSHFAHDVVAPFRSLSQLPGDYNVVSTTDCPPPGMVHLWITPLDLAEGQLSDFLSCLSEEEFNRSSRFYFPIHRNRYIAAHGWLRRILSRYLSLTARELDFSFGPKGKPALSGGVEGMQFNMAHSEGLALIAVSWETRVGVDIERVRPLKDSEGLVARFFSTRESAAFSALPEQLRATAFFNLWTRKEAWLKATGEGIADLLSEVEVSFLPGEGAALLTLPDQYRAAEEWRLYDVPVSAGFCAALAASNPVQLQVRPTEEISDFQP